MRHRVAHRKLGRVTEHRLSMLRNQATALLKYEHLTTTVPKAKELRPFVERLITVAKRGLAAGEANGRVLNARRLVMEDLQDREVVSKLFDTIAPRFATRPGGYTRLMRTGYRKGDSAELAQVELIGSEFDPTPRRDARGRGEAQEQGRGGTAARRRRTPSRHQEVRRRQPESHGETVQGRRASRHDTAEGGRKLAKQESSMSRAPRS
jgi:large subunit ribosomal protein L17